MQVDVSMKAQPQRPLAPDDGRLGGMKEVSHVIAVSSCKGGALHIEMTSSGTPRGHLTVHYHIDQQQQGRTLFHV